MRFTSLHTIVTGLLIRKQYPIHWYLQLLFEATRCFEEMHFDSLQNIQTVRLKADELGSVYLPCNAMDLIKVGVPHGQYVRPMFERDGINSLFNYDANDNKVLYPDEDFDLATIDRLFFNGAAIHPFDNRGLRFFGMGANDNTQSFKYISKENRIQLNQHSGRSEVIVQFIDDGTNADNATMVDPKAKATIEAYADWQMKENGRQYSQGDRERAKSKYEYEHKKYRARKNSMTKAEIMAMFRDAAKGSPKI